MMRVIGLSLMMVFSSTSARAQSIQPFIDQVKENLAKDKDQKEDSESFIEKRKREILEEKGKDQEAIPEDINGSYIQKLKRDHPERFKSQNLNEDETPWLEKERQRLLSEGTENGEKSPIETVQQGGKSELELKRPGKISGAFGLILAATLKSNRSYTSSSIQANSFDEVYGNGSELDWHPDFTFFYEWQPWHSEWVGNVGLVASLGLSIHSGKGIFGISPTLTNPISGDNFGGTSDTSFTFVTVPVTLGANFRLNTLRVVRPFVFAGGSTVAYTETRNDGLDSRRGKSFSLVTNGGVNILLDFFSRSSAWNAYENNGIKKTYLTLEYSKVTHLSGKVEIESSGIQSGFTFEF